MNQTPEPLDPMEHVSQHRERYAAEAWRYYLEHRRGAMSLNYNLAEFDAELGAWMVPCEYITPGDPRIKERGGWPVEQAPTLITNYKPDTEFVVMLISSDGATVTRCGRMEIDPPEAYRRSLAQPQPSKQAAKSRKKGREQ